MLWWWRKKNKQQSSQIRKLLFQVQLLQKHIPAPPPLVIQFHIPLHTPKSSLIRLFPAPNKSAVDQSTANPLS